MNAYLEQIAKVYRGALDHAPEPETTHWHIYHIGMYRAYQAHGILPGNAGDGYSGQNPLLLELFSRLGQVDAAKEAAQNPPPPYSV